MGFAGGATGDKLWLEHELVTIEDIPLDTLRKEKERRETALRMYLNYKEACLKNPAAEDGDPPDYDIRIWWTDPNTGERKWVKRLFLPAGEVLQWRTATLPDAALEAALQKAPDSDYRTPGNKLLVQDRAYIRLIPGLGFCIFSGDHDLPGYYILAQYVGWLYSNDALAAHNSGPTDTHKLSLRHKASMPAYVSGINGGPVQPNGQMYDLRYFWKNGPGSMFNAQSKSECNCRFVVEYPTQRIYENAPALFVDDEYCNPEVPYRQRVLPPRAFHSHLSAAFYLLILYRIFLPMQTRLFCPNGLVSAGEGFGRDQGERDGKKDPRHYSLQPFAPLCRYVCGC